MPVFIRQCLGFTIMLKNERICVIGAGKIGEAIIRGLANTSATSKNNICATTRHKETAEKQSKQLGIPVFTDNKTACKNASIIILAVKPQAMKSVIAEIRPVVSTKQLVISVAASVTASSIEDAFGKKIPVIRTMPNLACTIQCGMTGIAAGRYCSPEDLEKAMAVFNSLGRTMIVDEIHLNAVTGLSASGPAFLYIIIEALSEGGVKVGLPRETATELVAQAMYGAAKMVLTTNEHPAKLKDMVTTPAGCTIDGIMELEDGGIRHSLIKAVVKATERAKELSQQ
ncbi:MAG: pyrroline-5-carboxylate reductase [Planctomycetes bacterium]|nr:pyrroline-5-carboxylate reductase [Planctomycetota bacterium]